MKLIILLCVLAFVCADKLDRTYLPPTGAHSSGGSGNFLQTPRFGPLHHIPAEQNNFNGRANNFRERFEAGKLAHGAQNDYARNTNFGSFPGAQTNNQIHDNRYNNGHNQGQNIASNNFITGPSAEGSFDTQNDNIANQYFAEDRPERPQAAFERTAAILRQDSENNGETYSYAYETENGITAEESGVANNGVEAQGGYSYTGDDGQVYTIRYTADQNGFVPQGEHLPTPPPIPEEILKALEQNAADEAAGIFDDGSYDARKYGGNDDVNSQNFIGKYSVDANNAFHGNGPADAIITNSAAYLPPFSGAENQRSGAQNNQSSNSKPSFRSNSNPSEQYGAPPTPENNGREGFDSRNRQPSFSSRNGYQY